MSSRTLVEVLLALQICLIAVSFSAADDESASSITLPPNVDEHKILLECQHPDYRTYIKCLKRQKRHHLHSDHEGDGGDTRSCFEDCGMEQCTTTKCVHDCHKHCMKKTKETRQIITQYETTCLSDDCDEKTKAKDHVPANVTTNIDINNVIHNHIPKNEGGSGGSAGAGGAGGSAGSSGGGGKPSDGGTGGPGGTGGGTGGGGGGTGGGGPTWPGTGWYGGNTGLTLVPQIQLVPQITFGLGFGSIGGGYFPQPGGVDCSPCSNPFLRYRCEVSCYNVQGSGPMMPNAGRMANVPAGGCHSPQCVGGI